MSTSEPSSASSAPPPLPKLTDFEYKQYNRLADLMERYHNHFRAQWTTMSTACTNNKRPAGMSIKQFLSLADDFCRTLTMHHDIEEAHFFPPLGKKMEIFRVNELMKNQHKEIHAGLDRLTSYVDECRSGSRELRLSEMKGVLDSFGEVLWTHLDKEVEQLGAENMRKYWSLEELRRLPFG